MAVLLFVLASSLRPDAFFAGDSGVKLIAARNVLQHPSRPFEVDLPRIGSSPVPHVEPFFLVHEDHAHAITSPLFPVLTAPFLRAIGIQGLYILPAIGLVLTLLAAAWLGTRLDGERSAVLTFVVTLLGTPFLFYGLEYWEHTLALALGVGAIALLLRERPWAGGLLLGAAVALRPESAWFGVSAVAASFLLTPRLPATRLVKFVAGALVAMLPMELYTYVHFGTLVPSHLSTNAGGFVDGWVAGRVAIASRWLSNGLTSLWRVAPVVLAAVFSLMVCPNTANRRFLWALALADSVLVLLTAPNDGGAEWGPRYLLFVYVPLALLATDAVRELHRRRVWGIALMIVAGALCLWVQREAYRELRGAKATYGRIVDFVTREVPAGSVAITDVWWLDQVTAALTDTRQFLYAPDTPTANGIIRRFSDATAPSVMLIRSAPISTNVRDWIEGTCYFEEQRDHFSTRSMLAIRLRHRCPQ